MTLTTLAARSAAESTRHLSSLTSSLLSMLVSHHCPLEVTRWITLRGSRDVQRASSKQAARRDDSDGADDAARAAVSIFVAGVVASAAAASALGPPPVASTSIDTSEGCLLTGLEEALVCIDGGETRERERETIRKRERGKDESEERETKEDSEQHC